MQLVPVLLPNSEPNNTGSRRIVQVGLALITILRQL